MLEAGNHAAAVGLAGIPEKIRGFGHVKERILKVGEGRKRRIFWPSSAPILSRCRLLRSNGLNIVIPDERSGIRDRFQN